MKGAIELYLCIYYLASKHGTPKMDGIERTMNASTPEAAPPEAAEVAETDSDFQVLDPESIRLNRMTWLVFDAIFAGAICIASLIVWASVDGMNWIPLLVLGIGGAFTALFLWLTVVWPPWEYARTRWRLDEQGLHIRRGVFWRHQISVPSARMQHADVSQGPLQRQFGLGTLTVHTAGTQNASVSLDGLAHETAIQMRDRLMVQRRSGHVV